MISYDSLEFNIIITTLQVTSDQP